MDLNAPLGMTPPPRRRRKAPIIGAGVVALCLGGFGAYLLQADPHGGEPFATALIPPPPSVVSQAVPDPTPTGSIAGTRAAPVDAVRIENGVKIVSPSSPLERPMPRDSGPLVIDVSKALDGKARKTASTEGLPTINAAPTTQPATLRPRIAIFVSGMGLDAAATRLAIETMPAAVALAFVPTSSTSATSAGEARARGHEILLQLPMRNAGDASLGPHTIYADEPEADIARDMSWMMARIDGFDGVTNLLGAPVTSSSAAMTAILRSVGRHGIFYLDDGTSPRSVAPSIAKGLGVPAVQADVVLDATADPARVRANLDRLAAIARAKGTAIGMASGFPNHMSAIARFTADLDARGLTLVPVSAIASGSADLATTR